MPDSHAQDQPAAQDDLFGDADGDFEEELEPELQEVQDEEPEQPAAGPSNTGGALDRKTMKATLLALAKKRTHVSCCSAEANTCAVLRYQLVANDASAA